MSPFSQKPFVFVGLDGIDVFRSFHPKSVNNEIIEIRFPTRSAFRSGIIRITIHVADSNEYMSTFSAPISLDIVLSWKPSTEYVSNLAEEEVLQSLLIGSWITTSHTRTCSDFGDYEVLRQWNFKPSMNIREVTPNQENDFAFTLYTTPSSDGSTITLLSIGTKTYRVLSLNLKNLIVQEIITDVVNKTAVNEDGSITTKSDFPVLSFVRE
jgi:hypothetical protein